MKLLQPTFAGGELAPELYGRADLARLGNSARTMRNYIPRATGAMVSRRGMQYLGTAKNAGTRAVRLLPFVVSSTVAYVIELGHLYARFYYGGAPVTSGGVPVEIATPWAEADLFDVRFTQSADALFMTHRAYAPQILRRTGASSFSIAKFVQREGPFRNINGNEALLMASSSATGPCTLTTNFDLFTSSMVGALVYMEPKMVGALLPWVQGERTGSQSALYAGAIRESDGKVYRASQVNIPSGSNTYCETGSEKPTHEVGKAWDGPGDVRQFDVYTYRVGVEWEYQHSGYGIVEITGVTNLRNASGIVRKTLPPQVVGGVGTAANSWTLSGDGTTLAFAIPGAQSLANANYTVTVDGVPTQQDDNYHPPVPSRGGGDTNPGGSSPGTYYP